MKLRFKILVIGSALTALLIAIATMGAVLASAAGDPAAGKTVFTSSGCGFCHTLANLDDPLCYDNLTNHMPAYDESRLTGSEIVDVANYVDGATGEGEGIGGGCTACHDIH